MQVVFCDLQLGIKEQKVCITTTNGIKVAAVAPIEELTSTIVTVARENQIGNVVLLGPSSYTSKFIKELTTNGLIVEVQ